MILSLLDSNPLLAVLYTLALLSAITVHELAHALVADKLGDPTARLQGRISLNPLKHLDPIGAAAMLLTGFGWAKPVPVDEYNLRNPKQDFAWVALAGPASNMIFAIVLSLFIKTMALGTFSLLLYPFLLLNVNLALFNLLPVHPLDGGKIIAGILPKNLSIEFESILAKYGFFILIFLIFPFGGQSPASMFLSPISDFILRILL
ncbi:MAG: Peptidase M50 [Microgenomates group bacterium GW2011_GWF2_45_18]|nr:MAG: Peptidase M50 [Microgenomates group bacterium GW2011_GWF1_44_10]KKU01374.1 MAG: Peptidase M50 [Microgenomates group bacterium GW2011_GWF2_45_18]OGJ41361.1 MAG: hypothetical protein A2378_03665 [Candidatus Pacebacteria bacterium RIFOXYB1_FULL_44_10]HAU98617.1 site-2 protease family protein [Candidatus Paceibacterota bacterium]HAX01213.1 site-2 protease family protein [Candidatus Paceibacterota bacterium]